MNGAVPRSGIPPWAGVDAGFPGEATAARRKFGRYPPWFPHAITEREQSWPPERERRRAAQPNPPLQQQPGPGAEPGREPRPLPGRVAAGPGARLRHRGRAIGRSDKPSRSDAGELIVTPEFQVRPYTCVFGVAGGRLGWCLTEDVR